MGIRRLNLGAIELDAKGETVAMFKPEGNRVSFQLYGTFSSNFRAFVSDVESVDTDSNDTNRVIVKGFGYRSKSNSQVEFRCENPQSIVEKFKKVQSRRRLIERIIAGKYELSC